MVQYAANSIKSLLYPLCTLALLTCVLLHAIIKKTNRYHLLDGYMQHIFVSSFYGIYGREEIDHGGNALHALS